MFLNLNHYKLDVYKSAKELRLECYKILSELPDSERFNLTNQIRRASTSVVLNITEGCSRKSETERKRYFEIARGSVIELDSCMDIVVECDYVKKENLEKAGSLIKTSFVLLSGMLKS
ncbi:four helix bundle protein [Chryseobacterium daecheongense]|uniref:Four helix bundle protein n=1 Tax=Chryseobacterium daecheongense TaxID=192389 RepID=A0A3N0W679_9FLAO|nr:four helix bundle protein [Chryseobacterium daecheongense]ROI00564.1 four helix bundle protein [Chryseobacterium daecheongense]TDX94456.1 four helix bundle protein [Chryseobacterium daecheongense]